MNKNEKLQKQKRRKLRKRAIRKSRQVRIPDRWPQKKEQKCQSRSKRKMQQYNHSC